jgi:integrase
MYAFAGRSGIVAEDLNPARRTEQFKEHRRERFLTREELERLGSAIREAVTKGIPWDVDERKPRAKHLAKAKNRFTKIGPFTAAAIRLLLFTGCRLREILHLKWEQVDLERRLLFLADSETGRKRLSTACAFMISATPASFGAGGGLGLPIIGKLLEHTQASTTQRYAHLDADPLRRAYEAIGGRIAAALEGKRGNSVVQLEGRRRG